MIVTEQEVENVLKQVQGLEPVGVGARNLQECLLIQLRKKKKTIEIKTAEVLLENHFEEFTKNIIKRF